ALRVRVRADHHGRDGSPLAVALGDLGETELEQAVPVQHQERLAGKERLGPLDAASRIEDWILPRIPDTEPEAGAVAQVLLDAPPQVVEVEHDLADAAGAQGLEDVLEEGPARNRDERLRRGVGERPKARPAARREHHGAADHASSGTWAASRDRTDASSGRAASMRRPTAYTPGPRSASWKSIRWSRPSRRWRFHAMKSRWTSTGASRSKGAASGSSAARSPARSSAARLRPWRVSMPCSTKCSSSQRASRPSKRRRKARHDGSGWCAPATWNAASRSTAASKSGRASAGRALAAAHSVVSPMSS